VAAAGEYPYQIALMIDTDLVGGSPDRPATGPDAPGWSEWCGGSVVDPTARLVDTVVWDDARIGKGATLERCVVADEVQIPAGAAFRNCAIIQRDGDLVVADITRRNGESRQCRRRGRKSTSACSAPASPVPGGAHRCRSPATRQRASISASCAPVIRRSCWRSEAPFVYDELPFVNVYPAVTSIRCRFRSPATRTISASSSWKILATSRCRRISA
jgi:hypothetical protein